MQPEPLDLTVPTILDYIKIASESIGSKWLGRKIKEEKKREAQDKLSVAKRKHSYLYRPQPHPLVQWAIQTQHWRKKCLQTGRLELDEAILKFATLGRVLGRSRHQKGFPRLINRLKQVAEFDAAAFEAEVAAGYLAKGWTVEFVEEGGERSPDLKVMSSDGTVFWAECKCRDRLTERDKTIEAFWKELESTLLRFMGPKKLNFAIIVKALMDPERSMLDGLTRSILTGSN